MKKLAITLGICASLMGTMYSSNANAGIITILNSAATANHNPNGAIAGIAVGGLVTWGGFALAHSSSQGARIAGIVLIVLDANQELRQDAFEQYLSQKYSFIDDHSVIAELAALAKSSVEDAGAIYKEMKVSVPADQVRAILAPTSLTAEQMNLVINDLN